MMLETVGVDAGHYRSDDQNVESCCKESHDQDGSNLTKEVRMVEGVGSVEDDGSDQDHQVTFFNVDAVETLGKDQFQSE